MKKMQSYPQLPINGNKDFIKMVKPLNDVNTKTLILSAATLSFATNNLSGVDLQVSMLRRAQIINELASRN